MSNTRNNPSQSVQQTGSLNSAGTKTQNPASGNEEQLSGDTAKNCGPARRVMDIQPHMEVIASCGCNVGKVDHLEGNAIKLTKNDSPDGQHHFIPASWVNRVDQHVHLNKNSEEAKREWKSDAAGCSACG